jgi:hypothetical protein
MQKDERDLLEVLKSELEFLETGGYRRWPETSWRPKFIFEDSPSCINYYSEGNPLPCTGCALICLVPPALRSAKFPCRHIPLNAPGETLDSLYRHRDQSEIESTVATWLRAAITRLEEERAAVRGSHNPSLLKGTPLYNKHHPKCANPACATAFHWTGGGKFFRFRPEPASPISGSSAYDAADDAPGGVHGVRHYWLCERCSHVFTLVYDQRCGVIITLLWAELKGDLHQKSSAA